MEKKEKSEYEINRYIEVFPQNEHINTIRKEKKEVNIPIPPAPEIFDIDGKIFTDHIEIFAVSTGDEDEEISFQKRIRKVSELNGTPCSEPWKTISGPEGEIVIDLNHYPEGMYEMSFIAEKKVVIDGEKYVAPSEERIVKFTVLNRRNMLNEIGYDEGIGVLKANGVYKSCDVILDDYIDESLAKIQLASQKGIFISFETPDDGNDSFHKTKVSIPSMEVEAEVLYETDEDGEPKMGFKKGVLYIPLEEVPSDFDCAKVKVITSEYADQRMTLLLDQTVEDFELIDLEPIVIDYSKNTASIHMSEPSEGPYQIVNIVFDNLCDDTYQGAYEIIENGESKGIKRVEGNRTRLILNSPGEYVVNACIVRSEDPDYENPIVMERKQYVIRTPETIEVTCKERVNSTEELSGAVTVEYWETVETIDLKINKYTEPVCLTNIHKERNTFHIKLPNKIPKGYHILLCTVTYKSGEKKTVSKQFEVFTTLPFQKKTVVERKKEILENTIFAFSGHNIKSFAVLAVESLILRCNVDRKQIVFFDDMSTDGTKEEFEKRKVKVITWDEKIYNDFANSSLSKDLTVRVDQIVNSIFSQVCSKYICLLDGDTAYFDDAVDFMLNEIIDHEYTSGKEFDILGLVKGKDGPNSTAREDIGWQIWQNYTWVRNETLGKYLQIPVQDIEDLRDKHGDGDFNNLYDTGTFIYYAVRKGGYNNIYHEYAGARDRWHEELQKKSVHLGWLSSSMRNDIYFGGSWDEQMKEIEKFLDREDTKALCSEVGLHINDLKKEFFKNFRKSPL